MTNHDDTAKAFYMLTQTDRQQIMFDMNVLTLRDVLMAKELNAQQISILFLLRCREAGRMAELRAWVDAATVAKQ